MLDNTKTLPSIGGKLFYTYCLVSRLVHDGVHAKVVATRTHPPSKQSDVSYPVMAALETMTSKTLVIASSIGGLNEIAGRGVLVLPPGDHAALTGQILKLYEDPDLATELSLNGYQLFMHRFQEDKMVENYLPQYQELAGYA